MDVEYFTEGKNEKHQNSKFKSTFVKYKRQNIFFADSVFTKYLVSRR